MECLELINLIQPTCMSCQHNIAVVATLPKNSTLMGYYLRYVLRLKFATNPAWRK
jgi:hypothetical protein